MERGSGWMYDTAEWLWRKGTDSRFADLLERPSYPIVQE